MTANTTATIFQDESLLIMFIKFIVNAKFYTQITFNKTAHFKIEKKKSRKFLYTGNWPESIAG